MSAGIAVGWLVGAAFLSGWTGLDPVVSFVLVGACGGYVWWRVTRVKRQKAAKRRTT